LFCLPYLLKPSYSQPNKPPADATFNFILARINDIFLISFFYLNALLLFPRLLYKKIPALHTVGDYLFCIDCITKRAA